MTPDEEATALAVRLLERSGIPYMVAGSMASSHHGLPRMSLDVDIVIDPSPTSLATLVAGLEAAGLYVDSGRARDALTHRRRFNAIDPNTGMEIDFILPMDGPFRQEEFARARPGTLEGGTRVRLPSPEDTIVAKLEWARQAGSSERQLLDAAGIVHAQGAALDRSYVERWVAVLGITDLWHQVLAASP